MNTTENQNLQEKEILKNQHAEETAENKTAEQTSEEQAAQEEKELSEEEKLQKQLEEAQQIIEDQKDKYLRLSAEFDNYRKRTLKEKAELIKNGGEKAISAILPILDDLERALANMQKLVSLCFHNSGRPSGVIFPEITADVQA